MGAVYHATRYHDPQPIEAERATKTRAAHSVHKNTNRRFRAVRPRACAQRLASPHSLSNFDGEPRLRVNKVRNRGDSGCAMPAATDFGDPQY
jgi:hypothetical protein